MNIVKVVWKDHYSLEGWFEVEGLECKGHLNTSIGFHVKDTKEYMIIAMSHHSNEEQVGDILHILKKDIVSIEPLIFYDEVLEIDETQYQPL